MNHKKEIIVDAVGVKGHGSAAILLDYIEYFPKHKREWKWNFFILGDKHTSFNAESSAKNCVIKKIPIGNDGFTRLIWIYFLLPFLARKSDLIFSLANIGNPFSLKPQIIYLHHPYVLFPYDGIKRSAYMKVRTYLMRCLSLVGMRKARKVIVQTENNKKQILNYLEGDRVSVVPHGIRTHKALPGAIS